MEKEFARAEIIVNGLVQGVGFRYFVVKHALNLGLKGFVKNLYTGEVLSVVEGEKVLIFELFNLLKIGSSHSRVNKINISWTSYNHEFTTFEIRH